MVKSTPSNHSEFSTCYVARHHSRMALLALLCLCHGCSSSEVKTYEAGGTVTFPDGTPLAGGQVEFQETATRHNVSPRGIIRKDGTFQLATFSENDGAPAGDYRALVTPPIPNIDIDQLKSWQDYPEPIHDRFKDANTSGLHFTVSTVPAKNTFVIQVEPRPGS